MNDIKNKSVCKFFNFSYKVLLLITLVYLLVYPFIGDLFKDCFRFSYILSVCLILFGYIKYCKFNFYDICAFLLLLLVLFVSVLINQMPLSGKNIYHLISFCFFVFLVISQKAIIINKNLLKFIYYFSVIASIILFFYSQTSYAYWDGKQFVDRLTLGLYNANFTGMMLFFVYSLIIITMKYRKYKIMSILIEVGLLYLIFLTGSRTSLLAAIFISVISMVTIRKINRFIIFLSCSVPFIFVKFYLDLYNRSDTISFFGRDLFSGREVTYIEYLNNIQSNIHFLIGNIGENLLGNAHNAPLAIFASIGILGTIFYYFIIINKIINLNKMANTKIATMSIIVILACFIHSSGEAGCFLGVFPISVFVYTFFVLAGTKEENIK